jgi:hypothetical protein
MFIKLVDKDNKQNGGGPMVEVIDRETGILQLARKTSVIDVDVHEGLRPVRGLLPYLDEPGMSRVARFTHHTRRDDHHRCIRY